MRHRTAHVLAGVKYSLKEYKRSDCTYGTTKTSSLVLRQPPHTTVSQRNFLVTASGATAQAITLLAEDSWSMSDIPDWVKFTETSGSATGASEKQILFDVSANTTGSPHIANINIKSGRDTITLQVAQTGN